MLVILRILRISTYLNISVRRGFIQKIETTANLRVIQAMTTAIVEGGAPYGEVPHSYSSSRRTSRPWFYFDLLDGAVRRVKVNK